MLASSYYRRRGFCFFRAWLLTAAQHFNSAQSTCIPLSACLRLHTLNRAVTPSCRTVCAKQSIMPVYTTALPASAWRDCAPFHPDICRQKHTVKPFPRSTLRQSRAFLCRRALRILPGLGVRGRGGAGEGGRGQDLHTPADYV